MLKTPICHFLIFWQKTQEKPNKKLFDKLKRKNKGPLGGIGGARPSIKIHVAQHDSPTALLC
jgi:hypothetical protein